MSEEAAWHDDLELDDDVRGSIVKFSSAAELAKSYTSQEKLLGGSIRLPK